MTSTQTPSLYCPRCLTAFAYELDACPNLVCQRPKPPAGWGKMYGPGDLFDRNYRIDKRLAQGGAGITYTARALGEQGADPVGPLLAIKVLLAARDHGPYLRRLNTEAQIIQELHHPHIVEYLGFVHRPGTPPYLITAFERGGSLYDHVARVGTLPVRVAAEIGRQICWALEKAHERDIVHRDLKPENVLLADQVMATQVPHCRVADFGIAKVEGALHSGITRMGAFVGTPHYAAPEQFVGGRLTPATDVYALGAIMFFLMTGRHVVRFAHRLPPEDGFKLLVDSLPPTLKLAHEDPGDIERMQQVLAVAMAVAAQKRCTVVELDAMLAAVASGSEVPVPEHPPISPLESLPPPEASAIGAMGALDQLGEAPALDDRSASMQGERTVEGLVGSTVQSVAAAGAAAAATEKIADRRPPPPLSGDRAEVTPTRRSPAEQTLPPGGEELDLESEGEPSSDQDAALASTEAVPPPPPPPPPLPDADAKEPVSADSASLLEPPAAAAEDSIEVEAPAPPPVEAPPSPVESEPAEPVKSEPSLVPAPPPDPPEPVGHVERPIGVPPEDLEAEMSGRGGLIGGVLLGGGAMVAIGTLALLAVLALGVMFWPTSGPGPGPGPGPATDPPDRPLQEPAELDAGSLDFRAVRSSLVNLSEWLQGQCNVPEGARYDVIVVVEADGTARSVDVTTGTPYDECLEDSILRARFSRVGEGPVRYSGPLVIRR